MKELPVRRREFVVLLGAAAAFPRAAGAETARKMPLIGVLVSGSPPHPFPAALRDGLRGIGYEEDRNIVFDVRYAEGKFERAVELAAELVRLRVNIIVAHLTPAAIAAKRATSTIPIVMAPAGAPLQMGLVTSLARPGGNITGLSAMAAELGGKRLELLTQVIPKLARVAVLGSVSSPFTEAFVEDLGRAAERAGIRLQSVLVKGPGEFEMAFAAMAAAEAQAVIVQGIFDSQHAAIVALAVQHRIPIMSTDRDTMAAGGLISFWVDEAELFKRAPVFIDKILKGANPADLPVEQPTKFALAIN
ncbi:MAG: ABC transporter substrate-binding protein, partial [Planctomycetes bacterium]|nr:ABC transporter substrate-binding protein [Planctomycetota bacterium]